MPADEHDTEHYERTYERSRDELDAEIRRAAFGDDIGQFSWLTADEYRGFLGRLGLGAGSHVLGVACGSGGPALLMAQETGCRVTGVDIHESGIEPARARATELGLGERATFLVADAREPLPFASSREELDRIEGADGNAGFQRFLEVVDLLAGERRLSRSAYVATKR